MASPLKPTTARVPLQLLPTYLQLEMSRHVLHNIARFCLRAHTLRVETGSWQIHNRHCDKCEVQDKKYVLFLRPCLNMCCLRRKFAVQFADFTGADRIHIGDTEASYFYNISLIALSAEDVKLFHLKQTFKSLLFGSETIFNSAGSAQQAQQSTHLAEGLNPL